MNYLELILTSLVSILGSSFITRLLTVKQERKKMESEIRLSSANIDKLESDVIVSYADVYERLLNKLREELDREKLDCNEKINKLVSDYESRIENILAVHQEEIAILEQRIDDLITRVNQLELEKEQMKK